MLGFCSGTAQKCVTMCLVLCSVWMSVGHPLLTQGYYHVETFQRDLVVAMWVVPSIGLFPPSSFMQNLHNHWVSFLSKSRLHPNCSSSRQSASYKQLANFSTEREREKKRKKVGAVAACLKTRFAFVNKKKEDGESHNFCEKQGNFPILFLDVVASKKNVSF